MKHLLVKNRINNRTTLQPAPQKILIYAMKSAKKQQTTLLIKQNV